MEAISHLTKGLELLKTMPENDERLQQELTLQIALGVPLRVIKGFSAPEAVKAYNRARELCQETGETPQLFSVLRGLWEIYELHAELQTACELGEQLFSLAQRIQDPALLMEGHYALGDSLLWMGEFASSRTHQEQGIALYNPQQHSSHAFLYGYDIGIACLSSLTLALWHLGYPEQALRRSHEFLNLAHELSHPTSSAFALDFTNWLHILRREGPSAQQRAEEEIALSNEHGFEFWLAHGTFFRGWALAEQRQEEEGIALMHQGLADIRAAGAELTRPIKLAQLAEAYRKVGKTEEGFTVLNEALDTVNKTKERIWEAELYRLKGEFLLASTEKNLAEVETCLQRAIEIARNQSAKSFELRAVMSLSRLWQQLGKLEDARRILADIYSWFTEGFDTPDLKEAKALLEELSD
jgi:adenylate cyclase